MKILIAGLGSMGKRRIRNLAAIGLTDIVGCDVREDRRHQASTKYAIPTYTTFEDALAEAPGAVILSLPPDLHAAYAMKAINARLPFFVEASVILDGTAEVLREAERAKVVGVPSSTMRYYPGPKRIKALLLGGTLGVPFAWTYHSGQYLPDWHPWEPIDAYYVSQPRTGGCREIVAFELVWLTDVFGAVNRVSCEKARLDGLPAPIDDVYQVQVQHHSGVLGQLMVDVLARSPVRHIRIVCAEGLIEWNAYRNVLTVFRSHTGEWRDEPLAGGTVEQGYVNPEEPYIEEIADFLTCVRTGMASQYTLRDDIEILQIVEAADLSAQSGSRICVQPAR